VSDPAPVPPTSDRVPFPVTVPVLAAVLVRPGLWAAAVGALLRMAVPGWCRHRPFLPLPDPDWWAFRMTTAYGRPDAEPTAEDVVSYLDWCRATASLGRTGRDRPDGAIGRGPLAGRQAG